MFYWRGKWFPALVDVAANNMFDHPENSFYNNLGMKNSVESGFVIPVNAERVAEAQPVIESLSETMTFKSPIKYFVDAMTPSRTACFAGGYA